MIEVDKNNPLGVSEFKLCLSELFQTILKHRDFKISTDIMEVWIVIMHFVEQKTVIMYFVEL